MATLIKSSYSALVSDLALGPVLYLNSFRNMLLFLFNILLPHQTGHRVVAKVITVIIMMRLNVLLFLIAGPARVQATHHRAGKQWCYRLSHSGGRVLFISWLPFFMFIIVCTFGGTACCLLHKEGSDLLKAHACAVGTVGKSEIFLSFSV